jgi:hypothetical protein
MGIVIQGGATDIDIIGISLLTGNFFRIDLRRCYRCGKRSKRGSRFQRRYLE